MTPAELRTLDEDPDDDVLVDGGTTSRVEFLVVEGPATACTPVAAAPSTTGPEPSDG